MPRIGDQVRVIDRPFEDFVGEVTLVDAERRKVTIVVNMYGRQTPVQLGFDQVVAT
jgi:transcriptional antiterminator NusG